MITIFTPTYNSRDQLWTLFRSIEAQTCKDFEWLIVDDGSKDGSMGVVERFQGLTYRFPLRYFYQRHGGRECAIDRGLKEARGDLFFIADATDKLPPFCIEAINNQYKTIKDNPEYAGLYGNVHYTDGRKAEGQFAYAYITEVLRRCRQIGKEYKMLYFNEYIYTTNKPFTNPSPSRTHKLGEAIRWFGRQLTQNYKKQI